jgi:hypothetical protein
VRRSLITDFDIAKRRAAPVTEPASAIAANATMDSNLIIVRFFRKPDHRIMDYRAASAEGYSGVEIFIPSR